jgi:molybdopterin synthase catalytic subunit
MMQLDEMIAAVKANPNFHKAGMIASHIGIVRSSSRSGKIVDSVHVQFDQAKIEQILGDTKSRPGIVDVLIQTNSGHLAVGDEIMAVVVAGDIRENVFPALTDTVERLKTEASTKTESTKE